jgi:hypothetical protein
MVDVAAQMANRTESGVDVDNSVSRRQALKRGALVGGALVWTVPLIQVVSLNQSQAEAASAPPGGGHNPPPQHEIPPVTHSVPPATHPAPPVTTHQAPAPSAQTVVQHRTVGQHSQPTAPVSSGSVLTNQTAAASGAVAPQAQGTLPFTGAALPVNKGIAAGAGLVAAGSMAAYVARRKPAEPASAEGPATSEDQRP